MGRNQLFKTVLIVLLLIWAVYALWPTIQMYTMPEEERMAMVEDGSIADLEEKAIKRGLDLQGGIYLVYEVDFPALVKELVRASDDQLESLLADCRNEMNVSTTSFLEILRNKFEEAGLPLSRYWGDRSDSDGKVADYLGEQADSAVDRAMRKLRNRIDRFGVSEPDIQRQGTRRIVIALPGISDTERAKSRIGQTALLEFKILKDSDVYMRTLERIDRVLARENSGITGEIDAEADTVVTPIEQAESKDKVVSVNELFGETEAGEAGDDTSVVVDQQLFEEHPFYALLRTTGREGREVSVPIENVGAINRILAREDVKALLPDDASLLWASDAHQIGDKSYKFLYLVKEQADITGKYLTSAKVNISTDPQYSGMPVVNFTLNRQGGRIFSRVTAANVKKFLAIVLDDRVISAPQIQGKIPGGSGRITGIGDMDEARDLAIVLEVGSLPAPIHIVEERQIDATLGADSIRQGSYSALIGLGLVLLFMIIYYKGAGLIANLALVMNLIVLMAVLAQFQFTLTLPGIAGIILTIGMAVDANVLVFERIREELRTGKTVRSAIEAGYGRAFRTILDANLTTLFTALVLYQFGTGPVRGFAITLSIGIVVSMFTALVVTRVIFDAITARRTLTKLSI
ncbi:protein translocase subunit SecD [bacterium]|nr:protein translocase subunit SecD [bacterium]